MTPEGQNVLAAGYGLSVEALPQRHNKDAHQMRLGMPRQAKSEGWS